MRALSWLAVVGLVACSGGSDGEGTDVSVVDGDDDDDVGGDDDDFPGATGLPDVFELARDDTNYCESQPAYEPSVPTTSNHWFGEYSYDANGDVSGYEIVYMYPNETFRQNTGMTDCVVVWEAEGVVDDTVVGGTDIGMTVTLVTDVVQTTCDPNPFEDETNVSVHYNVSLVGETTAWYFDGGSESWATGYGDEDYLSWFFDDCKLF